MDISVGFSLDIFGQCSILSNKVQIRPRLSKNVQNIRRTCDYLILRLGNYRVFIILILLELSVFTIPHAVASEPRIINENMIRGDIHPDSCIRWRSTSMVFVLIGQHLYILYKSWWQNILGRDEKSQEKYGMHGKDKSSYMFPCWWLYLCHNGDCRYVDTTPGTLKNTSWKALREKRCLGDWGSQPANQGIPKWVWIWEHSTKETIWRKIWWTVISIKRSKKITIKDYNYDSNASKEDLNKPINSIRETYESDVHAYQIDDDSCNLSVYILFICCNTINLCLVFVPFGFVLRT